MAKKHKGRPGDRRPARRPGGRRRKRGGGLWLAAVVVLTAAAAVLYFMLSGAQGALPAFGPTGRPLPAETGLPADGQDAGGGEIGGPTAEAIARPTPEPTPAPTPVALEHRYTLVVDRGAQLVTAYTVDERGDYALVARRMICSVGGDGALPADGTYRLDGEKKRWITTVGKYGVYAQYATRIYGVAYFKSLPYSAKEPNALMADTYKNLGSSIPAHGVWLTCADAKWIYENIDAGTTVTFVTGGRDDALLAQLAPPALVGGNWDPTDPDARNTDLDAGYEAARPEVTPWLGVTPRPTFDLVGFAPGAAAQAGDDATGDAAGPSITQLAPTGTPSPYDFD
ncbi:MAG: murein L,D-transpeptidase [Clostridiales bacterium]|nr:murein L,D-transpeptidase [Clostridiales bacterium]